RLHLLVLVGKLEVTGKRGGIVVDVARTVGYKVLSPAVEGMTVRVGETVCDVNLELLGTRFVAEDTRVRQPNRCAVRSLNLRVMERPLLEVDRAAGIKPEAVGRVMRVG